MSDTQTEETDVQRAARYLREQVNKRHTARHRVLATDRGNLSTDSPEFQLLVGHVQQQRQAGEGGSSEVRDIEKLLASVEHNNY